MATSYKQIIDLFRTICNDHLAIKHFAVGTVSDIETPTEESPQGIYPYVFLRPIGAELDTRIIIYDFDLIVCDLAKDSEDLESRVHNSTLSIMQEILSYFKFVPNTNINVEFPTNLTWFVEANKNSVAGWTASLRLTTVNPLNFCETAFRTL